MTKIFVTLPVTDLERAKAYYTALGCSLNPLFSDENAACFVWSEDIYFMAGTREMFATLTDRAVVDPREGASALVSLSRDSREAVDAVVEAGTGAGGTAGEPQDLGFMYARDLFDPDGNGVQFMYMEPDAVEQGPDAYVTDQGAAQS